MKLVGKTFEGMPPYEIVDVFECGKCGMRRKGFSRKCPHCEAVKEHHEEEAWAGIL